MARPFETAAILFSWWAACASATPRGEVATARSLLAAGDIARATPLLEKACAQCPADYEAHFYLGYCYGRAGLYEDAAREFKTCVSLSPDRPEAHYNLGVILNTIGSYDEASKKFEEALLLRPGWADAHFNCGLAHFFAGRPLAAVRYLREAQRLEKGRLDDLYYLAAAYERIDPAVAISLWEEYMKAAEERGETAFVTEARRRVADLKATAR